MLSTETLRELETKFEKRYKELKALLDDRPYQELLLLRKKAIDAMKSYENILDHNLSKEIKEIVDKEKEVHKRAKRQNENSVQWIEELAKVSIELVNIRNEIFQNESRNREVNNA
jgi:Na+/phosphate symporter